MTVHAYSASGNRYIFIPDKDDFARVPAEVLERLGGKSSLKYLKAIDLAGPRIGIDVAQAATDIKNDGYHLNRVVVETFESGGRA